MDMIQSVGNAAYTSYTSVGASGGVSSSSTQIGSSPSGTAAGLGASGAASGDTAQFSMLSASGASSEPLQALATLLLAVSLLEALSGEGGGNDGTKAAGMLALMGGMFSGGESTFISMSSTSTTPGAYDAGGAPVAGGDPPPQIDAVA